MKCQDVRRAMPLLVAGEMALTEWAILETHLNGCVECRKELSRQRLEAAQKVQARRRHLTNASAVATVVVLVATGIGWAFYQGSLSEISRLELFHRAPLESAPLAPEAEPTPPPVAAPAAPPPAPTRPSPAARELPPATAPTRSLPASVPAAPLPAPIAKPAAEIPRPARPTPAPVPEPSRAGRPPAAPLAAAPSGELMPTQAARPGSATNAAPGAEAMPTSQGPSRPTIRGRE